MTNGEMIIKHSYDPIARYNRRKDLKHNKPNNDVETEEDMVQFFVSQPKSQAEGGRNDY